MQRLPHEALKDALSLLDRSSGIDNQAAHRLRVQLAEQLRQQLTIGVPTNADERTLRQLATQLRAKKVVVKLFLRHPLHAKLYLLFREDPVSPVVAYLGSSNLTFAGLAAQGELNVDVLDHDAALKLKNWFEDRWTDRFCVDITDEMVQIIEESWAREALIPPYHVYLKIAYHLSHEARAGLAEFRLHLLGYTFRSRRSKTGRSAILGRRVYRARADLSGGTGVTRLPARPDPRGLSVGACHANPVTGDIRLIEVKGLAAATGTVLLTPNERRVAEDRPDCYWLYVVTDCGQKPVLQEPIADPARFPWREVTKVQHYYLSVDAMTGPMPVGGSGTD